MNQTITSILERRSIRSFKPDPVSEKDINWILEAGLYAASARNRQPWFFSVVRNKGIFDRITSAFLDVLRMTDPEDHKVKSADPQFSPFFNAPTVIFISKRDDIPNSPTDCGNAAQNMCVAAHSLGLGSCYLRAFTRAFEDSAVASEIHKALDVPEGYSIVYAVALGYPDGLHPTAPLRNRDVIRFVN
jgi:nitroreductase